MRLSRAGYRVRAWNRSRAKAEATRDRCGAEGSDLGRVTVHDSVADAISGASIIITMLSDGLVTSSLLFPGGKLLSEAAEASALVCMSSIAVDTARRHGDACKVAGVIYVDAPVSGGVVGADEGSLAIMAGCTAETLPDPVEACLAVLGRVTLLGAAGAGSTAKLINQTIVACQMTAISDAFKLAKASGIALDCIPAALAGGFADSKILQLRWPRLLAGNFEPGGPAKLMAKDLRNTLAAAEASGLSSRDLPAVTAAHDAFAKLESTSFDRTAPQSGPVTEAGSLISGGDLDLCAVSLVL